MKKRFLCALLTLIMLVSLVPTTALNVSAAGMSVSESAITVLKQWNGYHSTCSASGHIGYGTACEVKAAHGAHTITEKKADTALRAALSNLDKAVNSFASSNGLSLSQGQHDALVLFSFDNGTAWTTGTGSFRSAVVNGLTGSEFLNAICLWNSADNDDRRLVEANMYLNGVYSSVRPSNFIRVVYDAGSRSYGTPPETFVGSISGASTVQYYDVSGKPAPHIIPTMKNHTFTGWYLETGYGVGMTKVTALTSVHHNVTLKADWVLTYGEAGQTASDLLVDKSELLSVTLYQKPFGKEIKNKKLETYYFDDTKVLIDSEYLGEDGSRWGRVVGTPAPGYWVMMKPHKTGGVIADDSVEIDVTVTVTNSYVRSRVNETIYSQQNGTYYQGQKLRIINTAQNDGFLWGQVARSADDNTPIGWVALMYTDWDSVKDSASAPVKNDKAIAIAVITQNGYVNVRSGAGTHNKIVGALSQKSEVELYEIKYVNGSEWGRCTAGWFCLSYANVTRLVEDNSYTKDENYLSYVFTGRVISPLSLVIYDEPNGSPIVPKMIVDGAVTVTKLHLDAAGITWGLIKDGWVKVSDKNGKAMDINLDTAKYTITSETLTVRKTPSHAAERIDTLVKGVEFDVNVDDIHGVPQLQIIVSGDTVWAWAYKVGETDKDYNGWVNLAGLGASRVDMPTLETEDTNASYFTNKRATIVNTDNVNVREYTDATYAKVGSLARGTTVAVWEEEDGWYKIDSNCNGEYDYEEDGWVSGMYLDIFDAESSTSGGTGSAAGGKVETGLGIVANTYSGVNVRSGAGTGYAPVGKILAGSSVEILEVKTVGSSKWGRVTQGWICMDYVTMISNYPVAGAAGSTGSGTGTSTNVTASETVIFTGSITKNTKIYVEPNESPIEADKSRDVTKGTPVTVHELMIVEESEYPVVSGDTTTVVTTRKYWARTNDGYILDPEMYITLDPLAEKTYTVTSYELSTDNELDVWEESCASVKAVPTLNKYDQVSVTTLKIVGKDLWCRVEYTDDEGVNHEGYVMMKYLTNGVVTDPALSNNNNDNSNNNNNTGAGNLVLGSSGNTANQGNNGFVNNAGGYRYTGRVIRTGSVNVRALPSQTASLTTTLKSGAALVIYETAISEGMAWGRCDAGWVYLYYVDLQPCNTAVDAKVVYNENTIAYTDANCSGVAGTYARMSVVDIYEVVGSMCRTDLGWVHVDNLG